MGRHREPAIDAAAGGSGLFGRVARLVLRWPWLVIALWIGLAAGLTQVFPPLTVLAQKAPTAILPSNSPSMVSQQQMTDAFKEASSYNILLFVITNDNGLNADDEATYRDIVAKLHGDTQDVAALQDFVTTPPLREVLASKDGKAWLLPVNVTGDFGSLKSAEATKRIIKTVKDITAGTDLKIYASGPAGTVTDVQDIGERDRVRIEAATVIALLSILLIVYRNPVTMLLPLITIVVSLVTAQAAVAGMGTAGLDVSNQTIVLLTAMLAGAGTDYAVFLISRYHDFLRQGFHSDLAISEAMKSVGPVITASAATVAVTFMGMIFTKLTIFSTVGIALAMAIFVGCLGALTFLPAIVVLTGRRGWIMPRRDLTSRFWKRSGIRIVRRPVGHLLASLVILLLLASSASMAKFTYDDRTAMPASAESIRGYDVVGQHFPSNASLPQYLLVTSPQDLRTSRALADMEQMAYRVSQLPDIETVRGITRPGGESLEQARLSFQSGEVGKRLGDTSAMINSRTPELNMLASGADQIADVLGAVRGQIGQLIGTVGGLVQALSYLENTFGGDKAIQDFDSANKLLETIHELGNLLGMNVADAVDTFSESLQPVLDALNASPVCDADPKCMASRDQLRQAAVARDNGTLSRIAELARQLQAVHGYQTLGATVDTLNSALDSVNESLRASGLQSPADIRNQLTQLSQGVDSLATGSRQVADGVALLVDQTKKLSAGLDQASIFLLSMKRDANTQSMAGFYIPSQILNGEEFRRAATMFISADGHSVRYLVQTKLNPFGEAAMDQVGSILSTARGAQPNTTLADATISMNGFPASLRDTRAYYYHDLRLIVITTIIVVFGILVLLLRALVAPLYLIVSVMISYLSALGLGVLLFVVGLGQELHWSLPGLTFIILVAVGADYNLLLISRIREESPYGIRSGVIRTVGQTGGVITAAGLIFAASMLGLQFATITTLVQLGFIIGIGILLDTFLVRTITVPATAVLIGKANWWPSRVEPSTVATPHSVAPQVVVVSAD